MKRLTERVNDGLIMTKQDSGDNVSYYMHQKSKAKKSDKACV
jgi:hypothetical protein